MEEEIPPFDPSRFVKYNIEGITQGQREILKKRIEQKALYGKVEGIEFLTFEEAKKLIGTPATEMQKKTLLKYVSEGRINLTNEQIEAVSIKDASEIIMKAMRMGQEAF